MRFRKMVLIATASPMLVAGCNGAGSSNQSAIETKTTNPAIPESSGDRVASAEAAAPRAIAQKASIVDSGDGMKLIRAGSNGWTCFPDDPSTPGPDPMCADANAMKWIDAWSHHRPAPSGAPGLIYMLAGGTDPSNTDPFATRPAPGADWIRTGPHVMLVGSTDILAGHPSGPKPDTSLPYVMWAGTPYAHLMVPVKS